MAKNLFSSALAFGAFLSASALLFAANLEASEGCRSSLAAIWTVSVSPVLPVLAALLAMDVWSEERRSGRIAVLLTTCVRERELVLGKFFGVWMMVLLGILVNLAATLAFLAWYAPGMLVAVPADGALPGFFALALQGALWTAFAVAASALFRHAATAACCTVVALVALPRAAWYAMMSWSAQGRIAYGEMPLDAHAFDMASGLVSTGTVVSYVVLTLLVLFAASKLVASLRLVGRGAAGIRFTTTLTVLLSVMLAVSSVWLACRLDVTLDLPVGGVRENRFSARTRSVLSEARGDIRITAFLPRRDVRFRQIAHLLRALADESEAIGGVRLSIRYVDPKWDLGAAERLVRLGATEESIVFERGRRVAILPLRDGYGERTCVSTILRISMPPQRRSVYWTRGHGESSFEAYGNFGLSDIARDLARDGYRNQTFDLAGDEQIPSDCALIVIAGPRTDFSRAETGRLDAYLRRGGRLLVLLNSAESVGISTLLSIWGLRPAAATYANARTLTGTDVIVSDFANHAVSGPLRGAQLVLERPTSFTPSAVVEAGGGADRIEFTALADVNGVCVAAVTERGAGAGSDLSIRPTRVIAVGDVGFVMNGQLAAKANANRDFFLNCVAYLSGTDAMTESGTETDRLVSGMDRSDRVRFAVMSAGAFPAAVFLLMVLAIFRRRHRQ